MEEDICKNCGKRPYVHKCLFKTKEIMTECEYFEKKIGSDY